MRPENQNIEHRDEDCKSKKHHRPSLQNTANGEPHNEDNSVEQAGAKVKGKKNRSSIIQTDIFQDNELWYKRTKWLNLRSDVVNKTLLRAIKRFYSNKFKIAQKIMVRKRFRNIKTTEILDALAEFWKQQFHNLKLQIEYESLAEFMMLFLDIKPKSTYKFDKSNSIMGALVQDCMRKYSFEKFRALQKSRELRILIVKIYKEDLDELFWETKAMEMNRERYIEAIEDIIDNN